MDVLGKIYVYRGVEKTEDGVLGFDANVVFAAIGVPNTKINLKSGKSWQKTILP
jgi:hypothetical protein